MEEKNVNEEVKEEIVEPNEENKEIEENNNEHLNRKPIEEVEVYDAVDVNSPEEVIEKVNVLKDGFKDLNTNTRKNTKIILGVLLCLTGGVLLLSIFDSRIVYASFFVIVLYFFVVIFYSKQLRKKVDYELSRYLIEYSKLVNSYIYGKNFMIKNIKLSFKTKLQIDELSKFDMYKDVVAVNARNYAVGKMIGVDFYSTDGLFRVRDELDPKKNKVATVGKMYKFNLATKEKGKTMIYISNKGEAIPTSIEGLEKKQIEGLNSNIQVNSNREDLSVLFNKNVIKMLNEFEINDYLEDVIINLNDSHVYLVLSYSDSIMLPPYNEDYTLEKLEQLRKDVEAIVAFMSTLVNHQEMKQISNR